MPVKKKQAKKAKAGQRQNVKQQVKQSVKVVVEAPKAKKGKGTSKPKTKIEYIPFGGGGASGVAPFDPSMYALYRLPPEGNKFPYPVQKPETPLLQNLQTARLTYKGDNPPLEVSGTVAKKMLNRLEKQSNLSNEDTENVIYKTEVGELEKDYDERLLKAGMEEERRIQRQKRSEASKRGAETRRKKKQQLPPEIPFDTTPSQTEVELQTKSEVEQMRRQGDRRVKKSVLKPPLQPVQPKSRTQIVFVDDTDVEMRKGGVISQFLFKGYR
jgi:hypothetical protein